MDAKTRTATDWKRVVKKYSKPNHKKSYWQLANTLIPLVGLWVAAYQVAKISWWLALPIMILDGLFFIRTFIIMHDCGHGSFFRSKKLRTFWGYVTGVLCFTPYHQWAHDHANHHATSGNLDRRGAGDIWTLTVEEYKAMNKWQRLGYRAYRHPIVIFILGGLWLFQIRFRWFGKDDGPKEKQSVIITNIALALLIGGIVSVIGWKMFLMIQLPITFVSQLLGIWFFYVQHQFEDVYWERDRNWDVYEASMNGCSYLKTSKIMQFFSGSIGFHHIHHLSHHIPNYNLEKAYRENGMFQNAPTITLLESLACIKYRIYDEARRELIGWKEFKERYTLRNAALATAK